MSISITWPSAHVREVIDKIRDTIGRNITIFVKVSGAACTASGCTLDPVTNLSTNQFCPVCGGNYWITTTSAWNCNAHVRWKSSDRPLWQTGGIIDIGDCKVTIANSGNALANVKNSDYFLVDDVELYMKEYTLKGVQPISRVAVTLLEDPQ